MFSASERSRSADLPALEEIADLVAVEERVVVALLQIARTDVLERVAQVADQLVLALGFGAGIWPGSKRVTSRMLNSSTEE